MLKTISAFQAPQCGRIRSKEGKLFMSIASGVVLGASKTFVANSPFSKRRGEKVRKMVLFCSDPHYRLSLREFVEEVRQGEKIIPVKNFGGVLPLIEELEKPRSQRVLLPTMVALMEKLGVEDGKIGAHEDCGAYMLKYHEGEGRNREEVNDLAVQHLFTFCEFLSSACPKVQISPFYARVQEEIGKVAFHML